MQGAATLQGRPDGPAWFMTYATLIKESNGQNHMLMKSITSTCVLPRLFHAQVIFYVPVVRLRRMDALQGLPGGRSKELLLRP